ncbi:unnamed protein product [Schistosoma mattheei]|uniref:Uncharacterized protein n=1 Tax=Schistosoma mattheei TaxID=31246 RepID=A0A3P7YDV5_9TREM|nr:unnamed protein product [Schistosoma mattheei]
MTPVEFCSEISCFGEFITIVDSIVASEPDKRAFTDFKCSCLVVRRINLASRISFSHFN